MDTPTTQTRWLTLATPARPSRESAAGPSKLRDKSVLVLVPSPCSMLTFGLRRTVRNAIANYMSYSKSKCRSIFTQGQRKRMYLTLTVARKYVPVCTSS